MIAAKTGRLDTVLAASDSSISRSQWQKWIKEGRICVNGKPVHKAGLLVSAGAVLQVEAAQAIAVQLHAQTVPFQILYQDRDIIVVDKPAGVIVHPGEHNERGTLVHGLIAEFPELAAGFSDQDQRRPGIVHRLDKGTSGVMVIARTAKARLSLIEQFQNRQVHKLYYAWVFGHTPVRGEWRGAIARHPKQRQRFVVVARGKPAHSEFVTVARCEQSSKLQVILHTGRTHQIRVHAAHAGHALLGDAVYRRRGKIPTALADWAPERDRPALHAAQLGFVHPRSGKAVQFSAALPADLLDLDQRYAPI